jgi:hypothetical protein
MFHCASSCDRKGSSCGVFAAVLLLLACSGARAADQDNPTGAQALEYGVGDCGADAKSAGLAEGCRTLPAGSGEGTPAYSFSGLNSATEIARGGSAGLNLVDGYARDLVFATDYAAVNDLVSIGEVDPGMQAQAGSSWIDEPLPRVGSLVLLGLGLAGVGIARWARSGQEI